MLGEGASGTVILATDKSSNEKVAIKVIHMPSQPKKELVLKELDVRRPIKTNFLIFKKIFQKFFAQVLITLNHPNLVNCLDVFLVEDASEKYGTTVGNWDSKKKKGAELWIVMEFLSGGALTDLVTECSSELKEKHIAAISKEVCSAY